MEYRIRNIFLIFPQIYKSDNITCLIKAGTFIGNPNLYFPYRNTAIDRRKIFQRILVSIPEIFR